MARASRAASVMNDIPSIMLRGLVVIVCRCLNSLIVDDDTFSANNLYCGADLDGGVVWALRFPFVTVYLHIAIVTGTDGFNHSYFARRSCSTALAGYEVFVEEMVVRI